MEWTLLSFATSLPPLVCSAVAGSLTAHSPMVWLCQSGQDWQPMESTYFFCPSQVLGSGLFPTKFCYTVNFGELPTELACSGSLSLAPSHEAVVHRLGCFSSPLSRAGPQRHAFSIDFPRLCSCSFSPQASWELCSPNEAIFLLQLYTSPAFLLPFLLSWLQLSTPISHLFISFLPFDPNNSISIFVVPVTELPRKLTYTSFENHLNM